MPKRVQYGLSRAGYAVATIAADGSATFGAVKPWPGAVNLNLDQEGDTTKFRADNKNYWVGTSNMGYSGSFESALVPQDFLVDVLGYKLDANGVLVEDASATGKPFAFVFQCENDDDHTNFVLYNCNASRPAIAASTTEETVEPQTQEIEIEVSTIYVPDLDVNIVKASTTETSTPAEIANWYTTIYVPVAPFGA